MFYSFSKTEKRENAVNHPVYYICNPSLPVSEQVDIYIGGGDNSITKTNHIIIPGLLLTAVVAVVEVCWSFFFSDEYSEFRN